MVTIVGIRFKKAGKVYFFDPVNHDINEGDTVIVETSRGVELGMVVFANKRIKETSLSSPLKPVLRIAADSDRQRHAENRSDASTAMIRCQEIVGEHGLEMNLIEAEYTFDKNKLIFYFTADGRVDFRNLVKDLASEFRTRIELRQVGVRDKAKLVSGIGPCGKKTCCSSWMGDFVPVSIKMAKEQNLSLNPTKISGLCGRLMCCLKFEHDYYVEVNKTLPNQGEVVNTPDGKAITINSNPIKEEVTVKMIKGYNEEDSRYELDDEYLHFKNSDIKRMQKKSRRSNYSKEDGANE